MTIPLQVTFRQMEVSSALEARIRELIARLERFNEHIQRCHVVVEPLPGHSRKGALYGFGIDLTLPDQQIAVHRAAQTNPSHEDPYVALRDAYLAARRKLRDYQRKRRQAVKHQTVSPRNEPATKRKMGQ